jgi:ubiquinone/menaquinone biosynthesis C-methylase UbiE
MRAKLIDLMEHYPVPQNRLSQRFQPTDDEKSIAKEFGKEFFDGDRRHGYGGFSYNPKFWTKTVSQFIDVFELDTQSSVLDVGCAKGFMLVDFMKALPGISVAGIDVSEYAISQAHPLVKSNVKVANCLSLPYADSSFDIVISINTIHNLDVEGCIKSIKEIERVKRKDSYIVVDGWSTLAEKSDLDSWVLTAQTVLSHRDWEEVFHEAGYTGKYSFWKVR